MEIFIYGLDGMLQFNRLGKIIWCPMAYWEKKKLAFDRDKMYIFYGFSGRFSDDKR